MRIDENFKTNEGTLQYTDFVHENYALFPIYIHTKHTILLTLMKDIKTMCDYMKDLIENIASNSYYKMNVEIKHMKE